MALPTPETATEVVERVLADLELALAPFGAKPSLPNSWIRGLAVGYSNRVFEAYFALDQAALEALPDTAVDNLQRWAAIYGVPRIQGAVSSGNAIVGGTVGSVVPEAAVLAAGDGRRYVTTAPATISSKALSVASITRSGTTATLTTTTPHELGSQIRVSVSGANEPEYNVTDVLATITANDEIEYEVSGSPASPATGTIVLSFDSATLPVESEEPGSDQDLAFDSAIKLESPIAGVENTARVDFDAVGGGSDLEPLEDHRERLLDRIQNPVAHFNVAEIRAAALSVAGVTRVFVQEITPNVGQVTIYFTRDNDESGPIPSGSEIAAVDDAVQAIRPANSDPSDVIVLAPTAIPVNFTFTAISPNTATMKAAVEANLEQFFSERPEIGQDVSEDAYRSAIFNTVDTVTGSRLQSFTITLSGDVSIAAGELAILGSVTFS